MKPPLLALHPSRLSPDAVFTDLDPPASLFNFHETFYESDLLRGIGESWALAWAEFHFAVGKVSTIRTITIMMAQTAASQLAWVATTAYAAWMEWRGFANGEVQQMVRLGGGSLGDVVAFWGCFETLRRNGKDKSATISLRLDFYL